MTTFVAKRVLDTIPILLVVAVVVFGIVHLTPGDPARVMLGDMATEVEVTRLRAQLGLDRPIAVQFVGWMGQLVRGDLGTSIFVQRPVLVVIAERAEATVALTLISLLIAIGLGVTSGLIAAVRHNTWLDAAMSVIALVGVSIPNFWLGLILILYVAVGLGWLPAAGYVPLSEDPVAGLRYMALPALTLGLSQAALISRITRSAMLDVLRHDYVRTAVAKGLAPRVVVLRHALKNAAVPVITVIGLTLAALIGGAIVVETVFAVPGLGRLVMNSIARRDYPVVQGIVLVVTVAYVLVNLVVDLLYVVVDPRIRY